KRDVEGSRKPQKVGGHAPVRGEVSNHEPVQYLRAGPGERPGASGAGRPFVGECRTTKGTAMVRSPFDTSGRTVSSVCRSPFDTSGRKGSSGCRAAFAASVRHGS